MILEHKQTEILRVAHALPFFIRRLKLALTLFLGRFSVNDPEKRTVRELRRRRVLKDALPLHNTSAIGWLRHNWVASPCLSTAAITASFPINEVCRFIPFVKLSFQGK